MTTTLAVNNVIKFGKSYRFITQNSQAGIYTLVDLYNGQTKLSYASLEDIEIFYKDIEYTVHKIDEIFLENAMDSKKRVKFRVNK